MKSMNTSDIIGKTYIFNASHITKFYNWIDINVSSECSKTLWFVIERDDRSSPIFTELLFGPKGTQGLVTFERVSTIKLKITGIGLFDTHMAMNYHLIDSQPNPISEEAQKANIIHFNSSVFDNVRKIPESCLEVLLKYNLIYEDKTVVEDHTGMIYNPFTQRWSFF